MTKADDTDVHGVSQYNRGCRCDICRAAKRAKSQAYYIANRDRINTRNLAYYYAHHEAQKAKGRERARQIPREVRRKAVAEWRAANLERARQWDRDWAAANPDRVKAAMARYLESDKGREFHRRWRRENADRVKASGDKWRKANPDKVRQRSSTQRFKRRGAETLKVTPKDWRRLCERYRYACFYCGSRTALSQDHVVPLARGGRHSIGNIMPACLSCNSSKNAHLIVEWRARKRAA